MLTLVVLGLSIGLQLAAAALALRLARRTPRAGLAWKLIATALALMAVRRLTTLVGHSTPTLEAAIRGPIAESLALLIAILMLCGTLLMSRVFAELERQNEALRLSEHRYYSLFESSHDAILGADDDGRYVVANPAALDLLGYSLNELKGMRIADLVAAPRQTTEALWHRFTEDGSQRGEIVLRRKDGREVTVEYVALRSVLPNHHFSVLHDITERVRAQRERLKWIKLESLGVLAGGIAHGFNNLLASLFGAIELARAEVTPGSAADKLLADAEASRERATSLASQLLTFAKGGAPVRQRLEIGELALATATFSLTGTAASLEATLDPDLSAVDADAGQIRQAISNLVINAHQAMPQGGRVALVGRNVVEGTARFVELEITDQGTGIAQEDLEMVFDPYFTTKPGGTGLGLATAHSIATRHGGSLSLRSTPGVGTTATLRLPAAAPAAMSTSAGVDAADGATLRGTRVLLLDDETALRSVLRSMLERVGCEVLEAADGTAAVTLYRGARDAGRAPEIVITDLTIPGGRGGLSAAQEMLAIDPGARIIVVSGYATDPVMAHYAEHGFKGCLAKPFRAAELRKALLAALA